MKIGRNDPCPCGSGKKYKRCCLEADQARDREERLLDADDAELSIDSCEFCGEKHPHEDTHDMEEGVEPRPLARAGLGLTPYTIAKIAEDPRTRENLRDSPSNRQLEASLRERWTIAKVAEMTTEAIEDQLRRYGVAYTRDEFLTVAAGRDSAWTIQEVWLERDPAHCTGKDEDFLGFAACELWKRFLPERPSIEMIDDWMQEGYLLLEDRREAEACDLWQHVWEVLRPRFTPEMHCMDDAAEVFRGTQSLDNWCQDFETALGNAAAEDARFAAIGRRYCEEWIAQFPDEGELVQVNLRRAFAGFLSRLGETAAAEALLLAVVETWPKNVWGYVSLGDAYSHFAPEYLVLPFDVSRARNWLERGLEIARSRDDRRVLKDRLRHLPRASSPASRALVEPKPSREPGT